MNPGPSKGRGRVLRHHPRHSSLLLAVEIADQVPRGGTKVSVDVDSLEQGIANGQENGHKPQDDHHLEQGKTPG